MSQRRFRKLFLDSRFAQEGLGNDITFQLPQQVVTQQGDAVCVSGLTMPNVYQTVMLGFNDVLYYMTTGPDPNFPATSTYPTGNWYCAYRLQPAQYDGPGLAAEVAHALIQSGRGDPSPTVTYNATTGTLSVAVSDASKYGIEIFPMNRLQSPAWQSNIWNLWAPYCYRGAGSLTLDPNNLCAANSIVNMPPQANVVGLSVSTRFDTGIINLAPVQQVYIHCSLFDSSSLCMNGAQDVIALVPVNDAWGAVIVWQPYSPLETEAIHLGDSVINTIRFQFKDAFGTPLPMSPTAGVFIQLTLLELPTM
jgi:hypothetical protein